MPIAPRLRKLAVAVLLGFSLVACTTMAPGPAGSSETTESALRAQREGRHTEAARMWERAALAAPEGQQDILWLRAAEAWAAGGGMDQTRAALARVSEERLTPDSAVRWALLEAEQALLRGDPEAAAFYLETTRPSLPSSQVARYAAIEDSIARMRADPYSHVLSLIEREVARISTTNPREVAGLLAALEAIPSGPLTLAAENSPTHPAAPWAALAVRLRQVLVGRADVLVAARAWSADFPGHAVSALDFVTLASAYAQRHPPPASVAVLLPSTGALAPAAAAIRDGLMSAYLEQPGASELRFYPTGDRPETALAAHARALDDGADWIIGPLDRDAAEAVARFAPASVPTLLLNEHEAQAENPESSPLFSLSLSQEAEAVAVARRMQASGMESVISLSADTSWGQRVERAFVEAFEAVGGTVLESARFSAQASDHSVQLKQLLHIERSERRRYLLQQAIGLAVSFEPHVRGDFDALFLSAGPEQARQLRPQLRFFEAGGVPTFAMGRAFSGLFDPTQDQDLDGIVVPLTRAQLDVSEGALLPQLESIRAGRSLSLFALGQDAWRILRWLPLLTADPDLAFPGQVGELSAAANGNLEREPAWARFSEGRPRAVAWP